MDFDDMARQRGPAAVAAAINDAVAEPVPTGTAGVTLEDFRAYMPAHRYIFAPAGEMWPASSVNSRVPPQLVLDANGKPVLHDGKPKVISAAAWLDEHRPVEQMTWAPGKPQIIRNRLVGDGGWIDRQGCHIFNLYRPPNPPKGEPNKAGPWLQHIQKVYPAEADHVVAWLAHRVQKPHEKLNHALVLGGAQGVGKDTILEPVKAAVGAWNFQEVGPQQMIGRFNGFLKSVILRVSEARDLGDLDRFKFYDHLKTITTAPPDVLRVDEKNVREYSIFNCCGVIITSNHKTDGIYLPADDRRHFVAWSSLEKEQFPADYWRRLYGWYGSGGIGHVAAYLAALDISSFDAKAPPPKTPAFWAIVDANSAPEDAEMLDAIDHLGRPNALTIPDIARTSDTSFREWLLDRKNSRRIPHRLEECGYVAVRKPRIQGGLWTVAGKRMVIYAQKSLDFRDQVSAAQEREQQ